ncbi:MAG: hypothetical protein ABI637_10290 [Gemmatimonadota bacterium]
MAQRFRWPALLTLALVAAACSSDPTSPGNLLIGRFGDPELHAELLALHGGAELMLPCGGYFTSGDPIELTSGNQFSRTGKWYPQSFGVPVTPIDAKLNGSFSGDVVTLAIDAGGDAPLVYTLRRDVSGQLNQVACALASRASP